MQDTIYLDNAATTFPKPPSVLEGMSAFYARYGISPGRSGSGLAQTAARMVDETRRELHGFFNSPSTDYNRLVFGANATAALNLALQGVLQDGDHVVTTQLEHNSVLRPLEMLKRAGRIGYETVGFDDQGFVDPDLIASAITKDTRMVVINHGSNVLGSVQDLRAVGEICRDREIVFLVDAAQTAGLVPVDMTASCIDLVAFTGHKSLLGPVGIGGLAVGPDVPIRSTQWGGTGVESASLTQPDRFPYRLEAGTPNVLGIAGLHEGLAYVRVKGQDKLLARELDLRTRLHNGLAQISGIRLLGPPPGDAPQVPVLSCLLKGMDPEEAGNRLDIDHNIIVRTGLHCAPLVHKALGCAEQGAIRFSMGPQNTEADIDKALEAMLQLATIAAHR
jgi:cysteine desulfurase / selenocysteine lyase